jgi:hypothetical protein
MSEPIPDAPVEQTEQAPEAEPETFDADYVKKLRAEAAKHRTEARAATAELEKQRQASMSEAEKAVAEAEQRGRQSAVNEFGKRLAQTEFRAAAASRNPGFDPAAALEFVDLTKFIGEDGEPDSKAIAKAVERLIPDAAPQPPSFDGGSRQAAPAGVSMTDLIRKAAGRA